MAEFVESVVLDNEYITQEKQEASNVMKSRYSHGDEWETYVADTFEEMGIQSINETFNDGIADRIADYRYEGTWVEAKTFINGAEVTKIIRLHEALSKHSIKMYILCEWAPNNRKFKKHVNDLRKNGLTVFEGKSSVDNFIINEGVRLDMNKEIEMSVPMKIPFNRIVPHPNNRDLNIKNVPVIKASIISHGFFTQINVVPVGDKTKQKMWNDGKVPEGISKEEWFSEDFYMIFEGHTRYYALKELVEKGYTFPNMEVSTINVPWITSDEIDKLHKMLIKTNTSYQGWKLRNFVKSHKGNHDDLNNKEGSKSYGLILKAMNQAKKQKWGEATPVYVFAHKGDSDFDNIQLIKDGEYTISDEEYSSEVQPILDLMNSISNAEYSFGGRMRYILVNMRVSYNTNDIIRKNWDKFLGVCKLKFSRDLKNGVFPDTQDKTKEYWDGLQEEFIYMNK